MTPFPAMEWDASRLNPEASTVIQNVIPTKDGYRPFPSLYTFTDALPAAPKGGLVARLPSGANVVLAFTAEHAYKLAADASWDEIGGPYNLADTDYWSIKIFGQRVIAANINDPVQYYDLDDVVDFQDLPNAPDQFRYVAVSGDYLLLLSTADYPNRLWRSGVNDTESWTPRVGGSDFQDLPDGGWITGAVGRDRGAVIFSQNSIRLFEDQPGSPLMFTLTKAELARGVLAPASIVERGSHIEYLAEDGFFQFGVPESAPIGAQRVDYSFLNERVNTSLIEQVQGASDPINKLTAWLYTDTAGQHRIVGRQWEIDQWFSVETDAVFLLPAATSARDMDAAETDDDPMDMDAEGVPDFDSRFWQGSRPMFGGFDAEYRLGTFSGPNLEATLECADMPLGGGKRGYVNGFRPVGVTGAYGRLGTKETLDESAVVTWTMEQPQNRIGIVPVRASGLTIRPGVRIPQGHVWRMIEGVEFPNVRTAGKQ